MTKKIKAGYYELEGKTKREKSIYVVKGKKVFKNFRHIGGILEIKRSKWYVVLVWYDGRCSHNDVVKECNTKQEAVNSGKKVVGERTGRIKETTGRL